MAINTLLDKYIELKNTPIKTLEELQLISSQVEDLAELCHSFYSQEFIKLPETEYLFSLSKKGESISSEIKEIKIGKIILTGKSSDIIAPLLSPESIVKTLLSDSSPETQTFAQLYLSQPKFYLLVNLGLYLEKQG